MNLKYLKTDIEKIEYLSNILKSIARGGKRKIEIDKEYKKLRDELLSQYRDFLPKFLITNSDIGMFWSYIKQKFKTYNERVNYIQEEFNKSLNFIQTKQDNSIDLTINDELINRNNLKKILKSYFDKNDKIKNIYGYFKLVKKDIGSGGTSIVKEFEYDNKKYAIKFLLENIKNKESKAFKRFKQAHINLLNIQHTGVILPQLHLDKLILSENIEIPYIIMPLATKTLKQYIKEKKDTNKFNLELFEKIFYELLNLIDYIHKFKIIHRDIKPENIFILDKKLILGDFDIAKFDKDQYIKLIETQDSERLANFHYSAPEQVTKNIKEIGYEADWYAFGQILYWMIIGNTLRGQSDVILPKEYIKYQKLIKNLLSENPKNRLNNKKEILDFLSSKLTEEQILSNFEDIIFKYMYDFAQSEYGFKKFSKIEDIIEIMTDLKDNAKELHLWFSQGFSDIPVRYIKKINSCETCWLIQYFEVRIKSIWIFKHSYNLGCSTMIIETDKQKPSGIYNGYEDLKEEEVGVFQGNYIDRKHVDAGWTEIDGKRVALNSNAEIYVRILDNDIWFIAPQSGPLIRNDKIIDSIVKEYKNKKNIDEKLLELLKNIRKPEYIQW